MKTSAKNKSIIFVVLLFLAVPALSQPEGEWHLDQGKAIAKKTISMPGKSSAHIYKEVNRWLVKFFDNPEDNIKARIDGEYLKGTGYCTNIIGEGESADLRYTFIFNVVDERVTMTITNGLIIHTYSSAPGELDTHERVEDYLQAVGRRTRRTDEVLKLLNSFSLSLLGSFEKSVLQTNARL